VTRTLLCVEHSPAIGGAARMLLSALAALDTSRFHAVVACNPGPVAEEFRARGLEVVPVDVPMLTFEGGAAGLARSALRLARASRSIGRLTRERRAAAIYANGLASALYAAVPARFAGVPLVWHVHEMYDDRMRMRPFVSLAGAAARVVICVSHAAAERTAHLGAPRRRCCVVHTALAVPLACKTPALDPAVPDGSTSQLLVALGAITPAKGHRIFVEAMAQVVRDHPHATALVVGAPLSPRDDAYLEALRADVRRLGLGDRLRFLGFRPDAQDIIGRSTIVVHPSTCEETFGLVALEAMAAGRPVIAARVGGIPEVVADGETGVLVAPGDAEALARAVSDLLCDPARRERMGAAGRRVAAESFGHARMIDGLNAAFSRALGEPAFVAVS
jgi:glycosyltransferase involved in cell wall biosynthesis